MIYKIKNAYKTAQIIIIVLIIFLSLSKCKGQEKTFCFKENLDFQIQIDDLKGFLLEMDKITRNSSDTLFFEKRNCLVICVDTTGCLLYNKKFSNPDKLESILEEFIDNPKSNKNFAQSPSKSLIYVMYSYVLPFEALATPLDVTILINDRYSLIKKAIDEYFLKKQNKLSMESYGKDFMQITDNQKKIIITKYPKRYMFMPISY